MHEREAWRTADALAEGNHDSPFLIFELLFFLTNKCDLGSSAALWEPNRVHLRVVVMRLNRS